MMSAMNLATTGLLLAQNEANGFDVLFRHLLAAVVFSVVGIVVLAISFKIMEKLTPFSIMKEIEEDQNVALAVVVGAVVIGISLIISSAIMG